MIETDLGDGVQALASAAYRAIEVEWESELGKLYRVQSRLETAAEWVDQGEPIVGTGQRMSVFERANNGNKFYRVVPAQ
jgi:hypothetical protein